MCSTLTTRLRCPTIRATTHPDEPRNQILRRWRHARDRRHFRQTHPLGASKRSATLHEEGKTGPMAPLSEAVTVKLADSHHRRAGSRRSASPRLACERRSPVDLTYSRQQFNTKNTIVMIELRDALRVNFQRKPLLDGRETQHSSGAVGECQPERRSSLSATRGVCTMVIGEDKAQRTWSQVIYQGKT